MLGFLEFRDLGLGLGKTLGMLNWGILGILKFEI